jgi:hypothetical protein
MASRRSLFWVVAFSLLFLPIPLVAVADYDEHGERLSHQSFGRSKAQHRERHRERSRDHGESYLKPADNPAYTENCGACHFPYQPGLLPSESWRKILAGLDDHFGQSFELDADTKKSIAACLETNAANSSASKISARIIRSLGDQAPMRITEVPYIIGKHRKISSAIMERPSVGSRSNCTACHTRAAEGIYDDDYVTIPE